MGRRNPSLHTGWRAIASEARGCAVALGNFDGVHLGHQYLLGKLARACPSAPLGVVTFAPHPRAFFRPQDPPFQLVKTGFDRASYLGACGVEHVFEISFDHAFAAFSPEKFVKDVLLEGLGVKHVACGSDFSFGYRRLGNVEMLGRILSKHGVGLTDVPALYESEAPISSTRIRRALQEGYPEKALKLLGRPWSVRGEVFHGDKRGRLLGFPTANVALGAYIEPARGAYICAVRLPEDGKDGAGKIYNGVANIGRRPTIENQVKSRVEAHLFDFSGDLYGREIEIFLLERLRDEQRFENLEALTRQINADAAAARAYFDFNAGKAPEIPAF